MTLYHQTLYIIAKSYLLKGSFTLIKHVKHIFFAYVMLSLNQLRIIIEIVV